MKIFMADYPKSNSLSVYGTLRRFCAPRPEQGSPRRPLAGAPRQNLRRFWRWWAAAARPLRLIAIGELAQPPEFLALAPGIVFAAQLGVGGGQVEVRLGAGGREADRRFQFAGRACCVVRVQQHSTQGHMRREIARR